MRVRCSPDGSDAELHEYLSALRNKVYAHTDEEADRRFFFSLGFEVAAETDWVPYGERFSPFPKELLARVVSLCDRLREAMLVDARRTWIALGRPQGEM
jgi:hypothetical protein